LTNWGNSGKLMFETGVLNNDLEIKMSSTREEIIRAAVRLFSDKGYAHTTIRDICSEADVNIAAVNYHFKGKKGLGDAVVDFLFENVSDIKQVLGKAEKISTASEWEKAIRAFIHNFIADRDKEEFRNYYRSRLIFLELNNPSELFDRLYSGYMGPVQKLLQTLIRMGLPEDAGEEEVSLWIVTLMAQCVMFRKKSHKKMNIAEIDFSNPANVSMVADHISSTLFSGLKFRKPTG